MNIRWLYVVFIMLVCHVASADVMVEQGKKIELPSPAVMSEQPIETLLQQRRSIRSFKIAPLSLAEIGQLLWAAQGVSDPQGLRTAPSAGALIHWNCTWWLVM